MEKTEGQKVKEACEAAGLSHLTLCRRIGWTSNPIYEVEKGVRNPKPETLGKVYKALAE